MRVHARQYIIGSARVTFVDDSGPIQTIQLTEGAIGPDGGQRLIDNVKRVMHFGFVSNPPIGSEHLVARLGGDRSQTLALGSNHQPSRMRNLLPGDSALHDIRGAYVWMTVSGPVIDAAGGNVTIQNAANVTITGSGTVTVNAQHANVISNDVNLGAAGGQPVARVGDSVDLGSGLITSGSSKVKAA